jgi:hypothetical protein
MEKDPQKRPEHWYQPGKHVVTTTDRPLPPDVQRILDAYYASVARKGLERLRRHAAEYYGLPDAPVRERQHEREPDQNERRGEQE